MRIAIIYESITREFETAVLIKNLLKKQGYHCRVFNEKSVSRFLYNPDIIIVPFLYKNSDCRRFNSFIIKRRRACINLQYEQVLSERVRNSGFHMPKDDAIKAMHVAWGQATYNRLLSSTALTSEHVYITGNISLLTAYKEFSAFYYSKDELAKKYSINHESEWLLFISSFTYPTLSPTEIQAIKRSINDISDFIDISCKTRPIIIKWLRNICEKYPNKIVIYRPHPNEYIDDNLRLIEEEFCNFKVIKELSVRQWISASDLILNWFSTSLADVYYAKKPCLILRPINIPKEYESDLMRDCKKVKDYDSFEKFADDYFSIDFPIEESTLLFHYCNRSSGELLDKFLRLTDIVSQNISQYSLQASDGGFLKELFENLFASISGIFPLYKFIPERYRVFSKKYYLNTKHTRQLEIMYDKKFKEIL